MHEQNNAAARTDAIENWFKNVTFECTHFKNRPRSFERRSQKKRLFSTVTTVDFSGCTIVKPVQIGRMRPLEM
jgi:hypothetical protein